MTDALSRFAWPTGGPLGSGAGCQRVDAVPVQIGDDVRRRVGPDLVVADVAGVHDDGAAAVDK
jgi:hypothetical protein